MVRSNKKINYEGGRKLKIASHQVVDANGLSCPMPIVKTKKAMTELEGGQVLEVHATDKGSIADIKAWSKSAGHQYLGTLEKKGKLVHYLRKANLEEEKQEISYPHTIQNHEFEKLLQENTEIELIDVREEAEFVFGHIRGAKSIPFGELENQLEKLNRSKTIYVICRTGNRSDYAAQLLAEQGFSNVVNVIPGMSEWAGVLDKEDR